MTNLTDILPQKFRKGLSEAEKKLLVCVQEGERLDLSIGKEDNYCLLVDNPNNADSWGQERAIRAELLRWLCTDKVATEHVDAKGIRVCRAKISGSLDLKGVAIPYSLWFWGCALESITLMDASARTLGFDGCVIGDGFDADRFKTSGSLFMRGAKVSGEVWLARADIGGDLSCTRAEFNIPEGKAFHAHGVNVKGNVLLDYTKVIGRLELMGADIGGDFSFGGAKIFNPGDVNASGLRVKGCLYLTRGFKIDGKLYLINAKVGAFIDDISGWPEKGKLFIEGFEYGILPGTAPKDVRQRLDWLRRQPYFKARSYEQLAKVYRDMGHESDAKNVLIAKNDELLNSGQLTFLGWCWNLFLKCTISYGYRTAPAIAMILWMMLIGAGIFKKANEMDVMQPSRERVYMSEAFKKTGKLPSEYPRFEPMIYSIDSFVPFVNLHQQDYWLPGATKKHGWIFRLYHWFHIMAGWVLSTLAAVSLSGLVRKGRE